MRELPEWRRQLIHDHLWMPRVVARYVLRTEEFDEKVQDGMLGLIRAARSFEPGHGALFRTYAWQRIRGQMLDGYRQRNQSRSRLRRGTVHFSLDAELRRQDEGPVADQLQDPPWIGQPSFEEELCEYLHDRHLLHHIFEQLEPEECRLMWAIAERRQRQYATEAGVTESRISQRKSSLMRKVRKIVAEVLRDD